MLLFTGRAAAQEPLSYSGGEVANHPHVYLTFWGKNWNEHYGGRNQIVSMFNGVVGSTWQQVLSQYFDHTGPISTELGVSSWTDESIKAPGAVNNEHVVNEIEYALTKQSWPGPGIDNIYIVFPAPGSKYAFAEGCGVHKYTDALGAPYAWVAWPGDEGFGSCNGSNPPELAGVDWAGTSIVASHEYAEAVTDPIPKSYAGYFTGWDATGEEGGEVADKCGSLTGGYVNGYPVTKLWDNSLNGNSAATGCALGNASPPLFYAVSTSASGMAGGSATLNGYVNPGAHSTSYEFEWGTSTSYGSKVPVPSENIGAGTSDVNVSKTIGGLKGLTTYHYRVVAHNSQGYEVWSADRQFTTPDLRPAITPESPTAVSAHGATLNASINPQGASTAYRFEYGTTTAYGTSIPVPDAGIGSGTTAVKVSQALSGLGPEREYHYRVVATNAEGTTTGSDRTFSTLANAPTFVSSFGGKGTGNGQFTSPAGTVMSPGGIVVGGNGNLYATDSGGNRVEKFGPAGEYLSQFGTGGSGNGQFNAPLGIALDPAGHLFVADANNHRIEEVSVNGAYIAQFGPGEGSEPLYAPWDVVADKAGHIFAADPIRGAVYEFSVEGLGPEGNHLLAVIPYALAEREGRSPIGLGYEPGGGNVWGVDANKTYVEQYMLNCGGCAEHPALFTRFGTEGSGLGQLKQPYDVAVRPSGSLLVLDHGNNRVEQFSQTGELLASFGEAGSGAGQLSQPFSIAYGKGSIYVADAGNNRIERWTQVGPPEAITQAATALGSSGATLNALIAPVGASTTYHFEYGPTTAYGTKAPAPDEAVGSGFEAVSKAKAISGLTAETTYHYRVVATSAEGTSYGEDMTFKTTK